MIKNIRFNQDCLKCGRRCVARMVRGCSFDFAQEVQSQKNRDDFQVVLGHRVPAEEFQEKKLEWEAESSCLRTLWLQKRKDGSVHVHDGVYACMCWRVVEDEEMTRHSWEQGYQHFHRGSSCGFNGCRHQWRALWKRTKNIFIPGELQKYLIRVSRGQVAIATLKTGWV